MASTHRPRSLDELAELARPTTYDPARTFKDQLRAIDTLRAQSITFRTKGDLENAFICMAKAAALVLDKLPSHSQYNMLSDKQKTDMESNGKNMLKLIGELRPQLIERHNEYLAGRANGTIPTPKRRKDKDDGSRQASTQPEAMPRTPTSMEDSSSKISNKPTPGVTVMLTEAQERERASRARTRPPSRTPSRDASRGPPEHTIPTPIPTPNRRAPPLSEPPSQRIRATHHEDPESDASERSDRAAAEVRAAFPRFQQTFDAELGAQLNNPEPLSESARMQLAHHLIDTSTVTERKWIKETMRSRTRDGRPPPSERDLLKEQTAMEDKRRAHVKDIFSRRAADQRREAQAQLAREQQASIEVQARLAKETQRLAAAEEESRRHHQNAAQEAQARVERAHAEQAERAERTRRLDLEHRVQQEQQAPHARTKEIIDQGVRRSSSIDHNPPMARPISREHTVPNVLGPSGHANQPSPYTPSYPNESLSSRVPHPQQSYLDGRAASLSIPYLSAKAESLRLGSDILPLESPTRSRQSFGSPHHHNSSADLRKDFVRKGYPSPIIMTTSPPSRDMPPYLGQPISYPSLMSGHQKQQGYQPSKQSIFAPIPTPPPGSTPHALLFQPNGVTELPPPPPDNSLGLTSWPPSNPSRAPSPHLSYPTLHTSGRAPYANYTGTAGLPPAPPHSGSSSASAPRTEGAKRLRQIVLPMSTLPRFLSIAALNTAQKRETCGLLLGKPQGDTYIISTLLVPKQEATENTCSMTDEELVAEFQIARGLITLGWIHTHPTQSCFMSSMDLHTHSGYQNMLPEAIAIVCAPKQTPNFGIFRLTDPPGLPLILACKNKAAFHPHSESEAIYTDADSDHVRMLDDAHLEIIDLR